MRLALALLIFVLGGLLMYSFLGPNVIGFANILGLFVMLTGGIQIALIVGSNMLPYTPPALEGLFANDWLMLWVAAPLLALACCVLKMLGTAIGML